MGPTNCDTASKFGHFKILKQLLNDYGIFFDIVAMRNAAYEGYFHIVKWLHRNRGYATTPIKYSNVCFYAIAGGHLDILKWAIHHKYPMKYINIGVADKNNLHILEWMRDTNHIKYKTLICRLSAAIGNIQMLEWCKNNNCLDDAKLMTFAVKRIDIDIDLQKNVQNYLSVTECIKWLMINGCKLIRGACESIEKIGNLELLKWLVLYGYYPNESTSIM